MFEKNEPAAQEGWERKLVEKLAFEAIKEQRRARRWGIFFKLLILGYLIVLLALAHINVEDLAETTASTGKNHTAIIDIAGVIADEADASADNVVTGLRAAFKDEHTKGVILRINSPGGSPVQSGYIYDEIGRLRKKHPDIKVYAVITDMCASGGYYIASAADFIYADKASIVGSIGVIMNGFGYTDTMQKLGVERRLLTAGEHKGFLDPFSPLKTEEVEHIQAVLKSIHQQFINVVKTGRGERLKANDQLFSGYIWTGEQGKELGLVDELGSASFVAREVIKEEKLVDFTQKQDIFERFVEQLGTSMGSALAKAIGVGSDHPQPFLLQHPH